MSAQQEQLNAIGNDLANVNTSGYQSERVAFGDLLYNAVDIAGSETTTGAGAKAQVIGRSQSEGPLQETGDPMDLAIEGEGYFQVKRSDGSTALTRSGAFGLDASGTIVNAEGNRLDPPIKLPAGTAASEVKISSDGTVTAGTRTLGQIKLVTVNAPDQLLANGNGELTPNAASGTPHAATGARIHQGAIEQSNVDVTKEMGMMVSTQRNFQLTSTAIQNESQMMSIANQLRTT
jgi:flagellar basal-body rod protein FlgG